VTLTETHDAARSSASRGNGSATAKRLECIAKKLAAGATFGAIALK
jgi:hypothetical protein